MHMYVTFGLYVRTQPIIDKTKKNHECRSYVESMLFENNPDEDINGQ